jgi:Fe-S-cluster containining protein
LVQIVDAAMDQAVSKSDGWLACKPGCTACCIGPFPITALDALRLRQGLRTLQSRQPDRAARVRERALESVARMTAEFPGDTAARVLDEDGAAEDEPCPALDPGTGLCELYDARPITCRTFGPAVRWGSEALGTCELCYVGATDEQIAECQVEIDPGGLEERLLDELGERGQSVVAFALTALSTDPDPAPLDSPPRP